MKALWGFLLLVTPFLSAQVNVLTERYDLNRTSAQTKETILSPATVSPSTFGKVWSYPVSGSVFAQPLYESAVPTPKGTLNLVFIVTMNDMVYAFNADSSSTTPVWARNLLSFVPGSTPVTIVSIINNNTQNIVGNIGIESTPAIDGVHYSMYLLARTNENGAFVQRLWCLDTRTGAIKIPPHTISASVTGSGSESVNNVVSFNPKTANQRAGILLANGKVYVAWTSHEDVKPYHGWLMSFHASNLGPVTAICMSPDGGESAIWMSGMAPAVDAGGNVYVVTGNGDRNDARDFGETALKFAPTDAQPLVDYFTPYDYDSLNLGDIDFGSSGIMLFPNTTLGVSGGKKGEFYLFNTNKMGMIETNDAGEVQTFTNSPGSEIKNDTAFFQSSTTTGAGTMYVMSSLDHLKAYSFNGKVFNPTPAVVGSLVDVSTDGGIMAVSANGTAQNTGILWVSTAKTEAHNGVHPGTLYAFNAVTLAPLWNSSAKASDSMGYWPKYANPTVANGRVYMANFPTDGKGSTSVNVYGLLASGARH